MNKVTVPFFLSHRGCPNTCIFCDQRIISRSAGVIPSPDEIVSRIGQWQRTANGRNIEVAFFGGTFTALPDVVQLSLLEPLQPMLSSGLICSVRISTRPDSITPYIVRRLSDYGVRTIEIGVQSMDDSVLTNSCRGHTAADSEAAIRCIANGGLSAGAQLMPGLPGDTAAGSLAGMKRVIAAGASSVRIYPVVVLRGTELADRFLAGEYQPLTVESGVAVCKVLLHEALRSGVDVIRTGLQADDGINAESVLTGCWHPAFGQLTRSELYFDLLSYLLSGFPEGVPISVCCHRSRLSDVVGNGRRNLNRLEHRWPHIKVHSGDGLLLDEIYVDGSGHSRKGSIIRDLNYNNPEEPAHAQGIT